MKKHQIELIKGRQLVDKLKKYFGFDRDIQLTDKLGVTQNHIAGWVNRNVCPEELLIRLCIEENLPPRAIFLGEGKLEPQKLITIKLKTVINSVVDSIDTLTIDEKLSSEVTPACIAYKINNSTYITKKHTERLIREGSFILDVGGDIELYNLKRLPNRKILATSGSTSSEVHYEDLNVIGKVIISIN